jgi:amidohydrolase
MGRWFQTAVVGWLVLTALPALAAPAWDEAAATAGTRAFAHYQALHRIPELGKQEFKTAAYIRQQLQAAGIRDLRTVAGLPTAVIAVIDTGKPGRAVALRAEMDARKGSETSGLPYASQIPGMMHSCGHDAHAAMLLAAAETIAKAAKGLTGRYVLVFQPAEETAGGADDIVASGILSRLGVSAILALHAAPGLPVGAVDLAPGPILAGSHYFTVTVTGRGSHAAAPQDGDDVPTVTADLISDLVRLPARTFDAVAKPVVISVTSITAGDEHSANVLPTQAVFRGTLRTFQDITAATPGHPSIKGRIEQFLTGRARAAGTEARITWRPGPPPTVNDAGLYDRAVTQLRRHWPALQIGTGKPSMYAEDFAYYTPHVPALYAGLGTAKGKLGLAPVHTDGFTVHPDALTVGVRLLLEFASLDTP